MAVFQTSAASRFNGASESFAAADQRHAGHAISNKPLNAIKGVGNNTKQNWDI